MRGFFDLLSQEKATLERKVGMILSSSIPPKYREPHYSTRLCRAQYQYVEKYYDKELFINICEELGVPLEYLLKDDNWISNNFFSDFMERLKQVTGDTEIADRFGRFTISPEAMNPVEYAFNKTFVCPALTYLSIPIQYTRYNNINNMRIGKWVPGYCSYIVTPKGKVIPHPDVCKNTIGVLSATENFVGLDEISVKHPRCIHRGDVACEFEVRYSAKTFWKKRFRAVLFFATGVALSYAAVKTWSPYLLGTGKVGSVLFLVSSVFAGLWASALLNYFSLLKNIQQYNDQSKTKAKELHDNYLALDRKYKESNLLRQLSLRLSQTISTKEIINLCLDELHERFGFSRLLIMLLSSERNRLYTAEVRGFSHDIELLYKLSLKYPAEKGHPQIFANILETGKTASIFDMDKFTGVLEPKNRELIKNLGMSSLIVSPIQDKDQKYGLLVVGSAEEDRRLNEDDLHMIESISQLLSLAFQTANNFERESGLRTLFEKYVPALVLDGLQGQTMGKTKLLPKTSVVTSMFVDLRDFTSRCERLHPEQVVELLNLYTEYVTARIAASGGIIDKLVGDGINAFYLSDAKTAPEQAKAALSAALYIVSDLDSLAQKFEQRGFGPACLGVGLHTGVATVGNMGCDRKLDYTAVGDTINLAARLQDLSKEYRQINPEAEVGLILVSDQTFSMAKLAIDARRLEGVQIRGRKTTEVIHGIDRGMAQAWVRFTGKDFQNLKTQIESLDSKSSLSQTKKAA